MPAAIPAKLVIWFMPDVTVTSGVAMLHIPVVKMALSPAPAFPVSVIDVIVFSLMLVGLMAVMILA